METIIWIWQIHLQCQQRFILNVLRSVKNYYCEVDVSAGPSYGAVLVDVNNVTGKEPNVYICSKLYADKYKEYIYRTLKVK